MNNNQVKIYNFEEEEPQYLDIFPFENNDDDNDKKEPKKPEIKKKLNANQKYYRYPLVNYQQKGKKCLKNG